MNKKQFEDLFDETFSGLGENLETQISSYWESHSVTKILHLDRNELSKFAMEFCEPLETIRYGAVGGAFRNKFAFNLEFFSDAPESIVKTLIRHELIHVVIHINGEMNQIHLPKIERSSVLDKAFALSEIVKKQKYINYNLEEKSVEERNSVLGGNEDELRKWIRKKEALS